MKIVIHWRERLNVTEIENVNAYKEEYDKYNTKGLHSLVLYKEHHDIHINLNNVDYWEVIKDEKP